jgi:hypothetical protein
VPQKERQALLRRAMELVGGKDVAVRLNVTQGMLDGWLAGHLLMPDRKFLLLVDLLDKLDSENPKK